MTADILCKYIKRQTTAATTTTAANKTTVTFAKDQNKSNTCHVKDCQKQSQQVGECGKVGGGVCMLVVLYYIVDSNHYHQEQLQLQRYYYYYYCYDSTQEASNKITVLQAVNNCMGGNNRVAKYEVLNNCIE